MTGKDLSARLSHELEHVLHYPDSPVPDGVFYPRLKNLYGDLFTKYNVSHQQTPSCKLYVKHLQVCEKVGDISDDFTDFL